jgi:hypothetical protein
MIHLVAFYPEPTDATSYYRGAIPFGHLHKIIPGLHVTTIPPTHEGMQMAGVSLASADLFFLQRPTTHLHFELATAAAELGVPLWIDYDDDLLDVPNDHEMHLNYQALKINIIQMVTMADVVTVSTEAIAAKLRPYSKKVVVIPNAFDDIGPLQSRRPKMEKAQNNVVSWRGGSSHARDIFEFAAEFVEAIGTSPDTQFHSMMYYPHAWNLNIANKCTHHDKTTTLRYLQRLTSIRPKIHVVPLYEHPFNFAKSHCAWLEATYAGAVVLAPDWPEWQRPGIENYKPGEFGYKLKKLLSEPPEMLMTQVADSWKAILERYALSTTLLQRREIVMKLLMKGIQVKTTQPREVEAMMNRQDTTQ